MAKHCWPEVFDSYPNIKFRMCYEPTVTTTTTTNNDTHSPLTTDNRRGGGAEVRHYEHGRETAAEISAPRGRSCGVCRRGRAAGRGSGGPLPHTQPRDGRGDERPARTAGGGTSARTSDGEGAAWPAAADAAAGRPRRSAPRAVGRAGCVAADERQGAGAGAEARRCGCAPRTAAGGCRCGGRGTPREIMQPSSSEGKRGPPLLIKLWDSRGGRRLHGRGWWTRWAESGWGGRFVVVYEAAEGIKGR